MYALLAALGEVVLLCVPTGNSFLKIMVGFGGITAATVYFLFRPTKKHYFYKIMIYCYLSVILLGSLLLGLESILKEKKSSFMVLGSVVVILVFGIEWIVKKINTENVFYKVKLIFDEEYQYKLVALRDSGNGLVEPISQRPVSIVWDRQILGVKEHLKKENFRMVPYHSIGNKKGMLEAYFISGMEIEQEGEKRIIENPIIAITKEEVSVKGEYQMILHPKIWC